MNDPHHKMEYAVNNLFWCHLLARELTVSSAQVAFQAARDGLGIAIGRLPLIDDDSAAGRVAIAVNHVVPVMSAYWLVKAAGTETRREIVAFRNWLLEEMSKMERTPRQQGRLATGTGLGLLNYSLP